MAINKQKLASLARRDILSYAVMYIDLLEDKKWEVETRAWSKELYQVVNPWRIEKYPEGQARKMVVTKSTQSGLTTNMTTRACHFASNWPVRIGFSFPREQDYLDYVGTRFDPMLASSTYLSSKLKEPNNSRTKRLDNSYLYFMELNTEPRSIPLDAVFADEVDLCNPDNLSVLLNRMDASRWKLTYYISTPTVPNYGVHGLYSQSDMRQWLVKCPQCNYEQPIDWEANLRVVGPANKPTRVFYGCIKCNAEITVPHMQTGRWVAQRPDRSAEFIGFHVHQMLTTPAPVLYALYRDPQTKLVEFYRKRLGMPYEIGGGSLERDDILAACFDLAYDPEPGYDGRSVYYMGVDQGNELQVIIAKLERGSNRPKVVHIELVPMDKGFARLGQLMNIFHIRKAVGDGNPNRHGMLAMVKDFPGRFLVADYIEQQREFYVAKKGMKDFPSTLTNVTINRTTGFDTLMESIKDGEWALPGRPPAIPQEVELVIDHLTAIKRDIETRRTQSGEVQVAVWRRLRAEHLAHAWLYMLIAMRIDKGRGMKVAIIGANQDVEQQTKNETDADRIQGAVALLAEVPYEQLVEFLKNEEADVPFPLSYKLDLARQEYHDLEILAAINLLIKDHKRRVRP